MKAEIETSDSPHCRTNEASQTKTDREDVHDDKVSRSDYFRSSTNRVDIKRVSAINK